MHPDINVALEGVICLTEKMIIALDPKVLLNKKTELSWTELNCSSFTSFNPIIFKLTDLDNNENIILQLYECNF